MDWNEVQRLFDEAESLPASEVEAYLLRECSDEQVRATVRNLLREAGQEPEQFLRKIVAGNAERLEAESRRERRGERYGPYEIEGRIAQGGMGEVYLARRIDAEFEHRIALKVVRSGFVTDDLVQRFRQERRILASLDHPNIVRLLDGGITVDGLPYLAMDFVEGVQITGYCEQQKLDARGICRLMLPVCDAVWHAHRHLVIHRDLKPSNILVTADGVPKLLDFGIAKLMQDGVEGEEGQRTVTEFRPMTPDYASPEQLSGGAVTTATDIFQLGAVLYRLLTGERSTGTASGNATLLGGDLAIIVRRAMSSEAERRYDSARSLAEDLQRYLDNRPVLARPDSWGYRVSKWVRRSPVAAAAVGLALVSGVAGTAATLYQARRAERRFEQVRALAGAFVFQFDDKIKDLPGSLPARTFAVDTAIRYLDSLSAEAGDDRSLLAELAAAYVTIARIQSDPSMANIGKPAEAGANLEKSLQLSRRVLSRDARNRAALRALTSALTQKGVLTTAVAQKAAEGGALLREAADSADRLLLPEQSPSALSADDFAVAGSAYIRHADQVAGHSPHEGVRYYEKALAAVAEASRIDDDKIRAEGAMAVTGSRIGLARVHRNLGNSQEVVAQMEAAAAILLPKLTPDGTKQAVPRQLNIVWMELARAYGNPAFFHLGQSKKALDVLDKIAHVRSLQPRKDANDFDALTGELFLKSERGATLLNVDAKAAMAELESALRIADALLERSPRHGIAERLRVDVENHAAELDVRMGRTDRAKPVLDRILQQTQTRLQTQANDLGTLSRLVQARVKLGFAHIRDRNWDAAERTLTTAISEADGIEKRYPDDLYFIRNHAVALSAFGDYQRARGNRAASESYYGMSLESWKRWRKVAPSGGPHASLYERVLERKIAEPANGSLIDFVPLR